MTTLVISDLDNTLYDWVTYFARSFRAMVAELESLLEAPRDQLLDEFRTLHQTLGTVEQPFALFELPAVISRFGPLPPLEMKARLEPALHAFNRERKASLRLYEGVEPTLAGLAAAGVTVVGHTEASLANAYYRAVRLGLTPFLRRLYVLGSRPVAHPDPARQNELSPPRDYVVEVPPRERKPNPTLLLDICRREGALPGDSLYVGDSLSRDIAMAHAAGVTSAWARYGTSFDPLDWATVVRVTHWTETDVIADQNDGAASVHPDFMLDSFAQLAEITGVESRKGR